MSKSRNFSIYLLKQDFSPENSLKDDHSLGEPVEEVSNLPEGARLYLADTAPYVPWWKSFWGIEKNIMQALKGALVFIPVNNRWVVLTFGHTYHNLKNESYEYDFGLRSTLNAIDREKIRSTDVLQPEDARRARIQSPVASDLTYFDIINDETIVKRLTGGVRAEFSDLFRNVSGSNSIKISSKKGASEIVELCSTILEIYERDDYKTSFPDLRNVVPVKDPLLVNRLDEILMEAFRAEPKNLVLTIPEILDYESGFRVSYGGARGTPKMHEGVFIRHYREYLVDRGIEDVSLSQIQSHQLKINDENGVTKDSYSIYQCLQFDCSLEESHYHLCEGNWYSIEKEYVERLKSKLDPCFIEHPVFQECTIKREDDYNESIKVLNSDYLCLDKKNISPAGQKQVEPCDLCCLDGNVLKLVHIKFSTRSSSLSHLFNQGINSAELLRINDESKEKLIELLPQPFNEAVTGGRFSVLYGIVTAKDKEIKSDALPIFSKISLLRAVEALRRMNYNCSIVLIKDLVDRKSENSSPQSDD